MISWHLRGSQFGDFFIKKNDWENWKKNCRLVFATKVGNFITCLAGLVGLLPSVWWKEIRLQQTGGTNTSLQSYLLAWGGTVKKNHMFQSKHFFCFEKLKKKIQDNNCKYFFFVILNIVKWDEPCIETRCNCTQRNIFEIFYQTKIRLDSDWCGTKRT